MKHKIITVLSAVMLVGLIPTNAATRGKSSSSMKSSDKAVAAKTTEKESSERKPGPKAKELAADLTTTQKSKLLVLLNEGTAKDLIAINGIAKVRAASIVEARPFDKVEEVSIVKGIGKVTFEKVILHGKSLTQRSSSKTKIAKK